MSPPITCRVCHERALASPPEQQTGICERCAPGVPRLPPLTRQLRPCAGCGGHQLVRAIAHERGAEGSDYVFPYVRPLSVAFRWTGRHRWLSGTSVAVAEQNVPDTTGALEMLICRACGLVSWYALAPEQIPIGPEWVTELHDVVTDGPYR